MLAKASSTDLPAQCSSVSHSSGEMKAEVLRFAKLFPSTIQSKTFSSVQLLLFSISYPRSGDEGHLHHLDGARADLPLCTGSCPASFARSIASFAAAAR